MVSVCFSLRWIDSQDSVRHVLQFLTDQLRRTMQATAGSQWRGRDVSSMIFGLNRVSSFEHEEELSAVLFLLATCVRNCTALSPKEVRNSCCLETYYNASRL